MQIVPSQARSRNKYIFSTPGSAGGLESPRVLHPIEDVVVLLHRSSYVTRHKVTLLD